MRRVIYTIKRLIVSVLLLIWFLISGSISALCGLLLPGNRPGMWCVRNLYCRGFHIILGYTPSYSGLEHIDTSRTYVLAANHESHMDTQSIFMSYPKYLYFIGKKELKYVPVVGWVIAALGMIFIDRKNPERAKASMQKAAEMIQKGKNVISFPEGTRTKDGSMAPFKKGLFRLALAAEVDIIPIAVCGAREVMASGSMRIDPGPIHIAFGKPIDHRKFLDEPEAFATHTQAVVKELKAKWTPRLKDLCP